MLYKTSTQALGRSTPALSLAADDMDAVSRESVSDMGSWTEPQGEPQEALEGKCGCPPWTTKLRTCQYIAVDSPLSTTRNGVQNEQAHPDRMTLWIKSVEST